MTQSEERRIRISALQFALELVQRKGAQIVYSDFHPFGSSHSSPEVLNRIATELHDEITTLKTQDKARAA
jgi:hypothetical protein